MINGEREKKHLTQRRITQWRALEDSVTVYACGTKETLIQDFIEIS